MALCLGIGEANSETSSICGGFLDFLVGSLIAFYSSTISRGFKFFAMFFIVITFPSRSLFSFPDLVLPSSTLAFMGKLVIGLRKGKRCCEGEKGESPTAAAVEGV